MNKTVEKILIWVASVIATGIIGYGVFIGYVVYSFSSGCGMDDGPFKAVVIDAVEISDSVQAFDLSGNGRLILENRNDTLSPIIALIENGRVKWTLDMDVRNTEGYETCRIWEISNLTVTSDTDPITLSFAGHWTYGTEAGSMEIDRENGKTAFV